MSSKLSRISLYYSFIAQKSQDQQNFRFWYLFRIYLVKSMNAVRISLSMLRPSASNFRIFVPYCTNANTKDLIKKMVNSRDIVVFMKGTPDAPRCGFSNAVVQILKFHGVDQYDAHDVLEDENLRQGLRNLFCIYKTKAWCCIRLGVKVAEHNVISLTEICPSKQQRSICRFSGWSEFKVQTWKNYLMSGLSFLCFFVSSSLTGHVHQVEAYAICRFNLWIRQYF